MATQLIEELSKSMELPEEVKHRITGCRMVLILYNNETNCILKQFMKKCFDLVLLIAHLYLARRWALGILYNFLMFSSFHS